MNLQITDVTLRDGLQMETMIAPEKKLELYELLAQCPYDRLEVTSFVHPKWVPQFGDSETFLQKVYAGNPKKELMAFVPNEKGLERMLKFPIPWASAFIAASDTFNQKNINISTDETVDVLKGIVQSAHKNKRKVRIYVSTVFGCPYEGAIPIDKLFRVLDRLTLLGADEIALSDTIGVAEPSQVETILKRFLTAFPAQKTAMHFHDTYGLALANVSKAYDMGVTHFDGSTGGIGGCPYAKGATGNLSTEEMLFLFHRRGILKKFPEKEVFGVLDYLEKTLKLSVHSHLYDIRKRGGMLYGIG